MRIGKLQCGGGKRHVMHAAYGFEPRDAFDDLLRRSAIVELQIALHTARRMPELNAPPSRMLTPRASHAGSRSSSVACSSSV